MRQLTDYSGGPPSTIVRTTRSMLRDGNLWIGPSSETRIPEEGPPSTRRGSERRSASAVNSQPCWAYRLLAPRWACWAETHAICTWASGWAQLLKCLQRSGPAMIGASQQRNFSCCLRPRDIRRAPLSRPHRSWACPSPSERTAATCSMTHGRIAQTAVGSLAVVLLSPARDLVPGIGQVTKPAGVQTFIAHPSVEALHVAVLHRSAWLNVD